MRSDAWWGLLLLGLSWAQPLRRNLVWNGGFEDVEEIVQPCSVWVESPTGSRATIPYPTLTLTERWKGEGLDTCLGIVGTLCPPTLNVPPCRLTVLCKAWLPHWVPKPLQRVRAARAADGSFVYGPLYFMPWVRPAPLCDSSGVEVWNWSLDTSRILRDTTRSPIRLMDVTADISQASCGGDGISEAPYYIDARGNLVPSVVEDREGRQHPGSGLVVPEWGSPDTISVQRYRRGAYESYPNGYELYGVWQGNTRRAFQGIQHVAPGWVAPLARPRFYSLPEQQESSPYAFPGPGQGITRSNEFRDNWFMPLIDRQGAFVRNRWGQWAILATLRHSGGDLAFVQKQMSPGDLSFSPTWTWPLGRAFPWNDEWEEWWQAGGPNYVAPVSLFTYYYRFLIGSATPRGAPTYDWWHYPLSRVVPHPSYFYLMLYTRPEGEDAWNTYFLPILGESSRRWRRTPLVIGPPNVVGRIAGLRSTGFVSPFHLSLIARAFGCAPRDTETVIPPDAPPTGFALAYPFAPPGTVARSDSLVRCGTLWDNFLWSTLGRWSLLVGQHPFPQNLIVSPNGKLYFSPLLSLLGQGWNYPVWHHRRIPYGRCWDGGKAYWIDKSCKCCAVGDTICSIYAEEIYSIYGWDTVRWAMRPGGRCAPLQPYRGEGYITLSYPVRELHGFRSSREYRAFLESLVQRWRLRELLRSDSSWWTRLDKRAVAPNMIGPPCSSIYPSSWCAWWGDVLVGILDTVLQYASIRCGAPTFWSDFRMHFYWELYMLSLDTLLRRLGLDLGISRDSLRRRVFGECCGAWWNARTELGGSVRYPYEQYSWRPVWKWGPQSWAYPTTGCPYQPQLRLRGLDPECRSHTFCAGGCPRLQFGFTPLDTFMFQSKWYFDSLAYYSLDSLDVYRDLTNLLAYYRFHRSEGVPWGWDYYLSCVRHGVNPYMYDTSQIWGGGAMAWLRPNPVVSGRLGWRRTGAPDMYETWYWSYRFPDVGCFVSFNHGEVDKCCGDAPYRVNRTYAIMGYLVDTLKPGRKYKVRMAVAVPEWSRYVINNIGVVVSREPIPNVYPYCTGGALHEAAISWEYPAFLSKSQWASWENRTVRLDSVAIGRWVVLEGELVAKGGEKFIYVGWLDSTRLDTVYRGEVEPVWQNGWMQRCLGEIGFAPWEKQFWNTIDWVGPIQPEELVLHRYRGEMIGKLAEWVQRWAAAGEASLHIDEVELWELEDPLEGRVEVVSGVCEGRGRGWAEAWGGVPPYRCFWDKPSEGIRIEGCSVELEPGWWRVRIIDSTGQELVQWVEVRTTPEVRLEVEEVVGVEPGHLGRVVVRVVGGTPPYQVWWSPAGVVGETLEVDRGGVYVAWVRDSAGCVYRIEVEVPERRPEYGGWVPSAFTPNGDGVNDAVAPVISGPVRYYRWRIWDRWGKLIFESRQVGEPWRGTYLGVPVPEDAYVWVLEIGFEGQEGVQLRRGTITILR